MINHDMHLFALINKKEQKNTLIAEGVEFTNGRCILNWLTVFKTTAIYGNREEMEEIYGRHENIEIIWLYK